MKLIRCWFFIPLCFSLLPVFLYFTPSPLIKIPFLTFTFFKFLFSKHFRKFPSMHYPPLSSMLPLTTIKKKLDIQMENQFDTFFQANERRIHFQIHLLRIPNTCMMNSTRKASSLYGVLIWTSIKRKATSAHFSTTAFAIASLTSSAKNNTKQIRQKPSSTTASLK